MKRTHPYCKDIDCKVCYNEHMHLQLYLEKQTNDDTVDHLGKYRTWFEENVNSDSETETGWAIPEVFEDRHIHGYIAWYRKKEDNDE